MSTKQTKDWNSYKTSVKVRLMIPLKAGKATEEMLYLERTLLKIESTYHAVYSLSKILQKWNNTEKIKYCNNKNGLKRLELVNFCVWFQFVFDNICEM